MMALREMVMLPLVVELNGQWACKRLDVRNRPFSQIVPHLPEVISAIDEAEYVAGGLDRDGIALRAETRCDDEFEFPWVLGEG